MIFLPYAVPALQEKVAETIAAAKKKNSQPLGFLQQSRVGYMANLLPEKEWCARYLALIEPAM